ncbi:15877_t:CDS:2, partial [Gigaspora margarita]
MKRDRKLKKRLPSSNGIPDTTSFDIEDDNNVQISDTLSISDIHTNIPTEMSDTNISASVDLSIEDNNNGISADIQTTIDSDAEIFTETSVTPDNNSDIGMITPSSISFPTLTDTPFIAQVDSTNSAYQASQIPETYIDSISPTSTSNIRMLRFQSIFVTSTKSVDFPTETKHHIRPLDVNSSHYIFTISGIYIKNGRSVGRNDAVESQGIGIS